MSLCSLRRKATGYEDGARPHCLLLDNDTPKLDFTFSGSSFSEQRAKPTEGFELLGRRLAPEAAYNGSDNAGQFDAGGLVFNNEYNPTYGSWGGWAYSNTTDVTTSGYLNQYSSFSGGGAVNSDTYLVGNAYPGFVVPRITRDPASTGPFSTLDITNTTYAALSMYEGDSFGAKKFGGESGNDPDFFALTIEGLDANDVSIGTIEFLLADFTFDDQESDYILDSWTSVDLSSIGDATALTFSLLSSDIGTYGMNTPAYFALDNVKFEDSEEQPVLTVTRNAPDQTQDLLVQLYTSDYSEAVVQPTVLVPAGESAVDVPWEIIDDSVSDNARPVTFTALAEGYAFAQHTILIEDDDAAVLTLSLSADSVDEDSGSLIGLLHRNSGDLSFPLTVSLDSDLSGQLDFPSSVTIPAGQRSQTFDVNVFDNAVVDDDRVVELVATKVGYESGSASVLILDEDVEVTLSLSRELVSELDSRVTIHAEDLGSRIASDSADNGSSGSGGFASGPVFLNNDFNSTYGSWSGFSVSNSTDVTTPGYLNQYSAISGGGALESSTYFVASAYGYPALPTITVSEDFDFGSLLVTNTTYAALSMQEGDAFAKKFGGETGDDPDYFLLTIEGFDSSNASVGTVDFYLADYRFADNSQDYLVSDWSLVDVSSLGSASSLVFSLTSSDVGTYGMNTPAYFAVDQLVLSDSRPSPAVLTVSRSDDDLSSALAVELSVDRTEVHLPSEVLIPAGANLLEVPVYSVADGTDDGDQFVSIVATAEGHVGAMSTLTVADNDAAVLTLSLSADSVDEDSGSLIGLLHRNSGDLSFPLTVSLDSDLSGQLDFPSSVTIPAGQRSQTFDVNVVDNAVVDDDRVVELVATKVGYESGSASVLILDEDVEVTLSLSRELVSELDSRVTIHAEDLGSRIASDSADNGSSGSGGFASGPVFLNNDFNSTYGSWSGFSVSNSTDVTTPGYLNQYSAISGGGALESSTYFVASAYGYPALPTITVSEDFDFGSLLVTNTTYAALSMQEGDAFAKKFGGETGDDPDYFLLTIEGFDSSNASVGTVDFYLADYRFADNSQDYLVSDWSLVDVSSLGSASSLVFSLTSSDVGTYGMNTPAYFAVDQLVLSDSRPSPAVLTVSRSDDDLSSALAVELSVDRTEVHLPSEVLIPAGANLLEVPVYSVADGTDDGDQFVSIVATAEGHVGAMSTLTVADNDAAVLTLSLSADSVDEDSGSLIGLLHRNSGDLSFPLTVSLDSDLSGQLDFPSSVTIPAGQRSQTFDVNVVDNDYRDGDRVVQLASAAENYSASGVSIEIFDDEVSAILLLSTDGGTVLSEKLGTDDFGVTLASRPQSNVLINLNLTDGDAGPSDMAIDASQVLFTPDNWNVPHMVSLTGIPDLLVEGDEVGNVTLSVDVANSNSMYSTVPDTLLDVVILDWQPSTLKISEDATSIFLADNASGIRLVAGTHTSGLNVVGNELPQHIVIGPLAETTGPVQVDLGAGYDVVELNGDRFTHLEGGTGIDRFVVNAETTFELLEYIDGRVFGFEEYVLQPQGPAKIEVDLNKLGQLAVAGEAVVLDLYVEAAEQLEVLGEGFYESPEMVGGQFAQVIFSGEGRLRVISERAWQNVMRPSDANHDGGVTTLDALVVLNHLRVYGNDLPEDPTLGDFGGVFVDVSGDGWATPLDSLLVLNQVESMNNLEGESSDLPMARDFAKWLQVADFQVNQNDGQFAIWKPSLMKVVSGSHPADQAIQDLYSSPDATVEMANDDESELVEDLLGSKNSV